MISLEEYKKVKPVKNRVKWRLPGSGRWGKSGDIGQRVQTSSYKMNKCWESNSDNHFAVLKCIKSCLKYMKNMHTVYMWYVDYPKIYPSECRIPKNNKER